MNWRVRPARMNDLDALFDLATMTGGGFTNLPPDRDALAGKLARSDAALARPDGPPEDELYVLALEEIETGKVMGTAQIFSRIGAHWPFYSYKITRMTQWSQELHRTVKAEMLNLVTDFDGATEVGGLFLHPDSRRSGAGRLLARSRYLFIAMHRRRFADRVLAELRGQLDDKGSSPFWEGLGEKFFAMPFQEADRFNALHGNQFIADLMPKHPIYTALLSDSARAAIGQPHDSGRPAMVMLEDEGFRYDGYIDIFDGGPTMAVATDQLRTLREARSAKLGGMLKTGEAIPAILAAGRCEMFNATFTNIRAKGDTVLVDEAGITALNLKAGDELVYVRR